MKLTYTIQPNDNFFNVKELLKLKFQISDRLLVKLKKNKKIWLNSTPTFVDSRLKPFDIVDMCYLGYYVQKHNDFRGLPDQWSGRARPLGSIFLR